MDEIYIEFFDLELDKTVLEWNTFVSEFENGHHHNSSYLRAIFDAYPEHENFSIIAKSKKNHKIVGVLPLIGQRSFLWGNQLTSMPFFNYGGALFFDSKVELALLEKADQIMRTEGFDKVEVRSLSKLVNEENLSFDGWHTHTHKVSMILDLPSDVELISSGKKRTKLKSQCKRYLRESESTGINIKQVFGRDENLLNDFYTVFSRNMRDLGTPVYGLEFFKSMLSNIDSVITVVYWGKKPVSCGFLFKHEKPSGIEFSIPWASSLSEFGKISVNLYMYFNIIDYAIKNNAKTFDFGRSTIDSGTYRFKKQWGALPITCHWHQLLIDESISEPRLDTSQGKMKYVVGAWKKLPVFIANTFGPLIVKNIP